MVLLSLAVASALQVSDAPLLIGQPGSATWTADAGFDARPGAGDTQTVAWTAGIQGKTCSPAVPVHPGETVVVTGAVRAGPMEGFGGLHLHLSDGGNVVHTAKRRIEATEGWEDLLLLATVPPNARLAQLCLDVRGGGQHGAGSVDLAGLTMVERRASSRGALPGVKRVILVTVETFRRDHVSAYGYPRRTTPHLDRMIAEGVSFDRHYATAPYTHPSLASLLTGVMPTLLGFTDNTPQLPPALPTLPERMAAAGYVTAGFSSQFVLSNRYGLNRGFHYYRNHPNDTSAAVLNAELLPFLDAHVEDNLFVWVHYFDPHGPYRPPAAWRARFQSDEVSVQDTMTLRADPKAAEGVPAIPGYVYDQGHLERRWYVAGYDGDVAFWDDQFGHLLERLRERGWDKDSVVVLTADHGESMTEQDRYFCHGSLWEHDIHVPMVVWGAGLAPARVDQPTSHLDILPTVLDLAKALPADASRVSMFEEDPERLAVATVGKGDALRWAVRDRSPLKVVVHVGGMLSGVYDLLGDPRELRNRVGLPPGDATKLWRRFQRLLDAGFGEVREVRAAELGEEERERLRALGYLE
jgi:arylsulfatase